MARVLSRSLANVRHVLLGLLALGLVLRVGGTCEAMAATPAMPGSHQTHCTDVPAQPDKPLKGDIASCGLCIALPDGTAAVIGTASAPPMAAFAVLADRLTSRAAGPASPPPRIA
jgi:hypothetical protein